MNYVDPTGNISQEDAITLTAYEESKSKGGNPTLTESVKVARQEYVQYQNYTNFGMMNGSSEPINRETYLTLGVITLAGTFADDGTGFGVFNDLAGVAFAFSLFGQAFGLGGVQTSDTSPDNATESTANIDAASNAAENTGDNVGDDAGKAASDAAAAAEAAAAAAKAKLGTKGTMVDGSAVIDTDHTHGPYTDGHVHWLEVNVNPKDPSKGSTTRKTGPLLK